MVEKETITELEQEQEEQTPEVDVPATLEVDAENLEELEGEVNIDMSSYRGFLSGQKHGHPMSKHHIVSDIGVSEEFIQDNMVTEPNDHASLWELHYRKDEFMDMDQDIFQEDVDANKAWDKIETRKNHAFIDEMTHEMLKNF